jgi:hypothetical protein
MPWEQVGRRRYYYRSLWVSGRPVRRYVGTGQVAELAAAADDLRRLERAVAARERQAEQARFREAEAPLLRLCGLTDLLARTALVAAGYHQHDRGAWRRTRESNPATTD